MCGIFGMSFQRKAKVPAGQREVLISSLAVANSYRGSQSWGVYVSGQKGKKARVRREVGDVANVTGVGSLAAWPVVFGHTRHATTGAITRENQHPFRVGSILLAHNGMVFNHDELNRKYGRDCTVDSQHFAHHISSDLTFSDIEAYGALEWTDTKRPNTVFLCRMREGQLSVAGVKNRKGKTVGIVWSSDHRHLKESLDASRLAWFDFEDMKEGVVYEVTAGQYLHTKRPVLALAESRLTKWERQRAARRTSGQSYGDAGFDESGWWDRHYPHLTSHAGKVTRAGSTGPASDAPSRRTPTRTYQWDAKRGTYEITGVGDNSRTALLTESEGARFQGSLLTDDGAGASSEPFDADEMEDYDAEANRLGLIKIDEGVWSEPESGQILDTDDLDNLLDAEESEVSDNLAVEAAKAEKVAVTESENSAWERTRAVVAAMTHGKE